MKTTTIPVIFQERRPFIAAWLICILLPLPALAFWRADYGRSVALGLFFIGCANLVAFAFQQSTGVPSASRNESPSAAWRHRMMFLAVLLTSAAMAFSLLSLTLSDAGDYDAVMLAFLIIVPSLCVVPLLTFVSGSRLAAVVFSLFLVFCMKLFGCVAVVLVHGWNADRQGYTTLPWSHPNLLVWLFLVNTGVLSVTFCIGGARKFREKYNRLERVVSYAVEN